MTKERAKSMDQRLFWTVDLAGAPGKLCRPPMASPEPGRLAFAPFQGASGECQLRSLPRSNRQKCRNA